MLKQTGKFAAPCVVALILLACALWPSLTLAREATYPSRAPVSQYSMPEKAEIALARSAAPPSISADATVMVLGRKGYTTVAKGKNGFLCLVERSWGSATIDPAFWNPKMRSPICFNPAAARTFVPIYLLKTGLVLDGKSRQEIAQALVLAFNRKELPTLAPGAMSYMMSRQQHIGDQAITWHPHLMFYGSGDATKNWGGNLPGSPVIAQNDPEERATIFMVLVGHWSDGTPASQSLH